MSKEPQTAKQKKLLQSETVGKTPAPSVEIKGKVVRTDPGSGRAQPAGGEGKAKILPSQPGVGSTQAITGETVAFEPPSDAEATAEDILLGTDDDSAEDQANEAAADELPAAADDDVTQAFTMDTLEGELPTPAASEPDENQTRAFTDKTIDSDSLRATGRRASAPTRKPAGAAPAAVQKGAPMASMLGGKYKLLKKLGQGGMGTVYKAHDEKLDRIVAIKVLAKEFSSKDAYVQRFLREGRVMVKLDHPNVIRCYDIDKDEEKGLHFLAIEFVEGGSVEGWLKKLGRFSIGDALHIILMAATGLQHAHEKSLIHRDVKPDNLLLTKEGLVKVADLGLAKDTAEDTSLTKTGSGAGTPIYMAPEQARDVKHVDCKVDIYALGVMLYVFLTGQPPFQGNTLVELISAKEKGKFEPMRKHNDDVPGKLDLIVDKMISKDPKNRYASCQEVIDEIEPLGLHNEALSFIESEGPPSNGVKKPASKVATTKGPSAIASKTSVSAKGPAAKTSAPASAGDTDPPEEPEEETHGVWYWQFESESGRPITKKLTTEQVRTLIKSGHLDATGRLSKTEKSGFRGAGTYTDFQPIFKSLRAATKANSRASSRGKMSDIIAEDERRRKYGWIGRMFKSTGGMLFGLLWIVLILGVVGGGGYFLWKYMNP